MPPSEQTTCGGRSLFLCTDRTSGREIDVSKSESEDTIFSNRCQDQHSVLRVRFAGGGVFGKVFTVKAHYAYTFKSLTIASKFFRCGLLRPARRSIKALRERSVSFTRTARGIFFSLGKSFVTHSSLVGSQYSV
jgi:hypothetical protein